jgi:hypothetical protein
MGPYGYYTKEDEEETSTKNKGWYLWDKGGC